MKLFIQRLKSKTYLLNVAYGFSTWALTNAGVLNITAPQAVAGLVLVNLVLRELTKEPLSEK